MAKAAKLEAAAWTDAGTAALAEERSWRMKLVEGNVAAKVKALHALHVPAWKRGLARCDDEGKVFAQLAIAWKPAAKAGSPNIDQLAAVMALSTACDNDEAVMPWFAEWIAATYGLEVALRVLCAMWPLVPSYQNKRVASQVSWLKVLAPDHDHIHDTSASSGKREFASYLRLRGGDPAVRQAALAKVWPTAPSYARAALAVATEDAVRGAEIARHLLENDDPHAFYAWDELPHLLRDPELVGATLAKRSQRLSYRIVANLGVKVLPMLVEAFAASMDRYARQRLMQIAVNLKSPQLARIFAEYAGQAPYTETVAAYFTRHQDLLELMLVDPELTYYLDDLRPLRAG